MRRQTQFYTKFGDYILEKISERKDTVSRFMEVTKIPLVTLKYYFTEEKPNIQELYFKKISEYLNEPLSVLKDKKTKIEKYHKL